MERKRSRVKNFSDIDSKFRFVILASKRARQLLKGSKPKIKTKSKNPIRIAQNEVKAGAIYFEIPPLFREEALEAEEHEVAREEVNEKSEELGEVSEGSYEFVEEEEEEESEIEEEEEEEFQEELEEDKD